MPKNIKTSSNNWSWRVSAIRLTILVCFFHFSCLNNGVAALISSVHTLDHNAFSPVLVKNIARQLNPSIWKGRLTSIKPWKNLLNRSEKVIEITSQRAIENILLETTFLRNWLEQSLHKTSKSVKSLRHLIQTQEKSHLNRDNNRGKIYEILNLTEKQMPLESYKADFQYYKENWNKRSGRKILSQLKKDKNYFRPLTFLSNFCSHLIKENYLANSLIHRPLTWTIQRLRNLLRPIKIANNPKSNHHLIQGTALISPNFRWTDFFVSLNSTVFIIPLKELLS